jgi:hypothetical protein
MSIYSAEDEARIRMQAFVRDWSSAGQLAPGQGGELEADLRVGLRRTGRMLRAGLALFTAIVVAAAVGLGMLTLDLDHAVPVGLFLGVCGAACFAAATTLARTYRLYRHGIEEMLAAAAVALWAIGAAILVSELTSSSQDKAAFVTAFAVAAAACLAVYLRFGFHYAGVAAIAAATLLPFPLNLPAPLERLIAAGIASALFVTARRTRLAHPDDHAGDAAAVFVAAAFLALYLVVNLHASAEWLGSSELASPWIRWTTYALTWLLPAAGLWIGVRERDRPLIDAAGAAALVTLVTNKPYLGLPRQPWDPIVFGVVLVAIAVSLKRWLAAGRDAERAGYTATRLSREDSDLVRMMSIGSSAVNPASNRPDAPAPSEFQGGRSGGAGGGAGF